MKRKHIVRGVNLMRAIEANARVSKVLLNEFKETGKRVEKELDVSVDLSELEAAIDNLIDVADAFHEGGNTLLRARPDLVKVPTDDQDDVILVVQCCGGK